jgi:hypothetical protein
MTHVLLRHAGGAISALTLSVDAPVTREQASFTGESGERVVPGAEWLPVEALGRAIDQLLAAAAGGPKSELDVRFGPR